MSMRTIEQLTDAEITQADQSADLFGQILEMTAPLDGFLSLVHAFEWLNVRDTDGRTALRQYFQSAFGDPGAASLPVKLEVAQQDSPVHQRFAQLLDEARQIAADERFFNWQPAFPSVWTDWDAAEWLGGFDAVIGNPPWDRMKLQQVEWFAYRRPEIARCHASRRPQADDHGAAQAPAIHFGRRIRARKQPRRVSGPRCPTMRRLSAALPRGRQHLLAVRRTSVRTRETGRRRGTADTFRHRLRQDLGDFFKKVATEGRLRTLYDFENRRTRFEAPRSSRTSTHASSSACSWPAVRLPRTTRTAASSYRTCPS